jgi:Class III cytochrome C family
VKRLGFISASGAMAAGVVLAAVVAWAAVGGLGMFSAGGLNATAGAALGGVTSHAALTSRCDACHTAPWSAQTMGDRCMACHADVRGQIQGRSGLHGAIVSRNAAATCQSCHPEHRGPAAPLTDVSEATFPHELTGYSLAGHQRKSDGTPFVCKDCHPVRLASFDQATCISCHTTIAPGFMGTHVAAFGRDCLPCHDGSGRGTADFDHNRFPFKLTGAHASLSCDRCHQNAGSITALRATPQSCGVCHANIDRHKGAFGTACGMCHATTTWAGARFDHSVFPTDHGGASSCKTCHPIDVTAYTCYGCPAHTPANTAARHENVPASQLSNCIVCHRGGGRGGD